MNRAGSVPMAVKKFHKSHIVGRNQRLRMMRDQRTNKKEPQEQAPEK